MRKDDHRTGAANGRPAAPHKGNDPLLARIPAPDVEGALDAARRHLRACHAAVWSFGGAEGWLAGGGAPDLAAPREDALRGARTRAEGAVLDAGIWRGGELAGALRCERAEGGWTREEHAFAAALADGIAVALERAGRERAERALSERERRLDEVERLAQLGTWEWHLPTDTIVWSREQLRIHGLPQDAGAQTFGDFLERVHPDDRARVVAECQRLIRTGVPFSFSYRIVRSDGTGREMQALGKMVPDAAGRMALMVGTSQDVTERNRADQALRASRESYRTVFDCAGAAIWVHDIETGEILDVNQTACQMNGYSVEEQKALGAAGLSWGEPPFTAAESASYIEKAVAGEPQRFVWRGRHKSGREVWAEVSLRRVTINGIDRLLATGRDISEWRDAEEALRRANEELEQRVEDRTSELAAANRTLAEREEYFRRLIENAHDITCVLDPGGTMTYQSPSLERLLGWAPSEIIGESAWDFIHPDDVGEVVEAATALLWAPGTSRTVEYRFRHKDGRWRLLEGTGRTLDPDSPAGGLVANVRDVTERRAATEALRRSEERFRLASRATRDVIWDWDLVTTQAYWSEALAAVLGYDPAAGNPGGDWWSEHLHPDDRDQVVGRLRAALAGGAESWADEYRLRRADGSYATVLDRGLVARNEAGDPVRFVGAMTDVTERREAEEALRAAKAEADRANLAKSEFLSRMSHELRTPMNGILGFAQLLERRGLPVEQQKHVQHILRGGRHLLRLIDEVLEIARIEAGRVSMSLEPVELGAVVREALDLVRPIAQQARVELDAELADPAARVHADRQRLTQVLLNLLSNAIKYNRHGGWVRLTCEPAGEGRTAVRVQDTGRGIPADRVDELFTPFARLGADQSDTEGTGLGLALSRRLAEAMGSTLAL
ncbi:MAG TPA: PAS domain S-box protein, partial [Longimicrobium sp.]|nr:PAS domain S-box protein [Longimicrobium sp.]